MRHLYLIRIKNRAELEHLYKILSYTYKYCPSKQCEECELKLCDRLFKLQEKIFNQLY